MEFAVMEIKRDHYLQQLVDRQWNGMVKIITGIRRCGKSVIDERGNGVKIQRKDTTFSFENEYLFFFILHKKFGFFIKNRFSLCQMDH